MTAPSPKWTWHVLHSYAGIPLVTVAEGEISELHVRLKGAMSALYLKDLAQKTRRGLEGRVRAGKSAGGISYGYETMRTLGPDGLPTTGDRRIVPAEAGVVRRIFEAFAAGRSPRAIAKDLNANSIPGPGGRAWGPSTIYGKWRRGTGILNNELYVGRLVLNRQRFVKDPDTGRRQARPNPPETWVTEEVPDLRTIDDALWERVKPKSVEGLFADLLYVGRAMDPARDWDWLRVALNRLIARANRGALPPPVALTAGRIFRWGLIRMAEVEADGCLEPTLRAIHYRQALMIAFLVARPVRRRALLAMCVDTHLVPLGSGFDLRFAAEDMKDGRERSCSLPRELVAPMRRYLAEHRRILLDAERSPYLWINGFGEPLAAEGLSREMAKVTQRHLGVALRPHAFRHIAATSIAEADPEHVNIIRDLLGHATLEMSERHYNRATGISSCTRVQSIVEDIRSGMHRMGRARLSPARPRGAR